MTAPIARRQPLCRAAARKGILTVSQSCQLPKQGSDNLINGVLFICGFHTGLLKYYIVFRMGKCNSPNPGLKDHPKLAKRSSVHRDFPLAKMVSISTSFDGFPGFLFPAADQEKRTFTALVAQSSLGLRCKAWNEASCCRCRPSCPLRVASVFRKMLILLEISLCLISFQSGLSQFQPGCLVPPRPSENATEYRILRP